LSSYQAAFRDRTMPIFDYTTRSEQSGHQLARRHVTGSTQLC